MLVKTELTLRPLEDIIDHIEQHGTLPVDNRGDPIYTDQHGNTCPLWEVIDGLVTTFDMWCTRHQKALPLAPLRMFVAALHYAMPLTSYNLDEIRKAMPYLRAAARNMDHQDAADLVVQTQIKAELQAKELP